jgi:hypothetical protein
MTLGALGIHRKSKDSNEKEKDSAIGMEDGDDSDQELVMHGYTPSAFGEVAKASLFVTSILLSLCMVILTLDYYYAFSIFTNKGATFMVFNDHETLSLYFVAMWHITTFWFLGLKVKLEPSLIFFRWHIRILQPTLP